MIFSPQSYILIFQDAVFSIGVGFIAGFVYQLLGVFLYKGRRKLFIRDVVTGVVFAVLVFSYSVSFANYPILRWYMVLFAAVGMGLFTPCFSHGGNLLLKLAAATTAFLATGRRKKIRGKLLYVIEKNKEKRQKIPPKNQPEVLKTNDVMLYN